MTIHPTDSIQGQLSIIEREILVEYFLKSDESPLIAIEVGTWMGGGSTLHLLREIARSGKGHLWGVEADNSIYESMIHNIGAAIPEGLPFFTPLFGFSQQVLPDWIKKQGGSPKIDFVFLDGGDSPREQIEEFNILDAYIAVGGRLLSHDAKLRKGKWFVPYIKELDNYDVKLHDISEEGILTAVKIRLEPSLGSLVKAQKILKRLQSDPIERLGRLSPRWALRIAAKILPKAIVRMFGQGRK